MGIGNDERKKNFVERNIEKMRLVSRTLLKAPGIFDLGMEGLRSFLFCNVAFY